MPKPVIHGHSYRHFGDLQMSSKEFYANLEKTIREYQFPNVSCKPVAFWEGGLLSDQREYLRISYLEFRYHVCAAPFGRSFFVSWWLEETEDWLLALLGRIPLIGRLFRPGKKTYYQIDAELIFTESIEALVRAAVASVAAEHGYRAEEIA